MLLDASNARIVRASPDKSEHSPLPDETADHEALLEATAALEWQDVSLSDETQQVAIRWTEPIKQKDTRCNWYNWYFECATTRWNS